MDSRPVAEDHTHSSSSTTFKADVNVKKYHCGFFCQRKTDRDVSSPSKEKPKDPDKPAIETAHK